MILRKITKMLDWRKWLPASSITRIWMVCATASMSRQTVSMRPQLRGSLSFATIIATPGRMPARKGKVISAADLFCGAGGLTSGLVAAAKELNLGLRVLAINHWQIAIDTHSSNHPDIDHLCEELDAVSPRKAVPSGKLDLLMAAPECIFHSVARGGRPVKDQSRSSAWMILRWCEALIIKDVLIENVPEFKRWGPLIRKHVVRRDKKTGKMIGSY